MSAPADLHSEHRWDGIPALRDCLPRRPPPFGPPEYYTSATRGQSNRARWAESAIVEVFHRAVTQSDITFWESLMQ
ncbi:MAG TPA: hypothetical protein VNH11_20105 [Pirellulales bacterium]|nr:hypothetical protein [Pirellulales bacterium]